MLNNIKIGNKLLIILVMNIILLVIVGGVAEMGAERINGHLKQIYNRDLQGLVYLLEADRDLHQAFIAERSMIFAEPESEAFKAQLKDYTDNKGQADERVAKFGKLASTEEQKALVKKYMVEQKKWHDVSQTLVDARQAGASTEEIADISLNEGQKFFDQMRGNINSLSELLHKQAERADVDATESYKSTFTMIISLTVFSILFGAAFTLLIARNIVRPLRKLMVFTNNLASGEFPEPLGLARKDEVGALAASFDDMSLTLQKNMHQIAEKTRETEQKATEAQVATRKAEAATRKAERAKSEGMYQAAVRLEAIVERVSTASEEISSQSEEIRQGTEIQSQRISETATAMEEMNATVLEVARNSSQAASVSQDAKDRAVSGAQVVDNSISAMQTTQRQAEELRENMALLGQQADAIGSVMNVINDIADQTNLLALNAAIEAARAGEAGRGFAVVADEVRKLAEKTMAATKEVGDSIKAIQQAANSNIKSTEVAAEDLSKAVDLANESGEVLREIVDKVEDSAQQIQSIATAAEQQSATSEEINRTVEEINRITAETSRGVSESTEALRELAEQMGGLTALIDELKGEGGGPGDAGDNGPEEDA